MRPAPLHRRPTLSASLLLALLLFRAYIPAGFMPASGTPFLLEICSSGLPMSMAMDMGMSMPMGEDHGHHPPGAHGSFEDCPFGSGPAAGPLPHFLAFESAVGAAQQPTAAPAPARLGVSVKRAHQARAPPSLA